MVVIAATAAYRATWIKAGGLENHASLMTILALLLIPSLVREANDRSALKGDPGLRHDRG